MIHYVNMTIDNYIVSLIMFLVGFVLYIFSKKNWSTGGFGLKIPFSLEKKSRLNITNNFFGKILIFGGLISAAICFLIGISPLKPQINENVFYNKINIIIMLTLAVFTEIYLRIKHKDEKN